MTIEVTVESADLRVGQANIRLVPVQQENPSTDTEKLFATGTPQGNQAITLSLTNPESFGMFMPGKRLRVSFDEVAEGRGPDSDKPQTPVTPPTGR